MFGSFFLSLTLGYSRKKPNREVEDMEFPGVSKKKSYEEVPGVLVFGLGISKGCNNVLWNFQGWSFVLSGIS